MLSALAVSALLAAGPVLAGPETLDQALDTVSTGNEVERTEALRWLDARAYSTTHDEAVRIVGVLGETAATLSLPWPSRARVVRSLGYQGARFPAGRPQGVSVDAIQRVLELADREPPMRMHAFLALHELFHGWKQPPGWIADERDLAAALRDAYERPESENEKTAATMALSSYLWPRGSVLKSIDSQGFRNLYELCVRTLEQYPDRFHDRESLEGRAYLIKAVAALGAASRFEPGELHRVREALRRVEDLTPNPQLKYLAGHYRRLLGG